MGFLLSSYFCVGKSGFKDRGFQREVCFCFRRRNLFFFDSFDSFFFPFFCCCIFEKDEQTFEENYFSVLVQWTRDP